jgi:hypothetical protein
MTTHLAETLMFSAMLATFVLAAPADAAPLPESGSTSYTAYFTCRQLANLDMGEVGSQSASECLGITRNSNDSKLFDTMSVRCLEVDEARARAYKFNGSCAQTDADGDKLFTGYIGPESGPIAYFGGTGKYKNLSMEGTWAVHDAPPLPAGQFAFVIDFKVKWQGK